MIQAITDYTAFFTDAKQAVQELDELKQKEKMLQGLEKELENSLKSRKKEAADTIAQTVKKRSDEIAGSYDAEIGKAEDRLKKVRSKREKAKNQGEKERIAEETQSLTRENQDLNDQMKTIFRANHVPGFCAGNLYCSLYFTKGLKEMMTMVIALLIFFLAVPVGIYFAIPERHALYLVGIYVAVIVIFGGIYVKIGNSTKLKHMDALKEGRTIRDRIKANRKKMKAIARSIRRDKDEAVYNLQKFDDEIAQLNQDLAQTERKKKEALNTLETVTKNIISDEIMGNYKEELNQIETDLAKTTEDLKETRSAVTAKALYITDNFGIYAGKEFMTIERLCALEDMIQSGRAANISEAIIIFKSKEYQANLKE